MGNNNSTSVSSSSSPTAAPSAPPQTYTSMRAYIEAQILEGSSDDVNSSTTLFSRVLLKNYCGNQVDQLAACFEKSQKGIIPTSQVDLDSILDKDCHPSFESLLKCFQNPQNYREAMKLAIGQPQCKAQRDAADKCLKENAAKGEERLKLCEQFTEASIICGMKQLLGENK